MSTTADDDEWTRFRTLVAALRPRTPDVEARKRTAAALCNAAYDERELLGVLDGADEAVYHSTATRCVAVVEITPDGPDLGTARPLGQAVDDPANWLRHGGDELAWAWRANEATP